MNWNALFASESSDVKNVFFSFYNKFNKLMNKHARIKTISNRKAKQFSKPWITKGLRKSITVKNRLYMHQMTGLSTKCTEIEFVL